MAEFDDGITKYFLACFNISDQHDLDLIRNVFCGLDDDRERFKKTLERKLINIIEQSCYDDDISHVLFNIVSSESFSLSISGGENLDVPYYMNGKYYYKESLYVDVNSSNDDHRIVDAYKFRECTDILPERNILNTNVYSYEEYEKYFSKKNHKENLVELIRSIDPTNVPKIFQAFYYRICKYLNSELKIEYQIKERRNICSLYLPDSTKIYVVGMSCTWHNFFQVIMNESQYAVYKLKS